MFTPRHAVVQLAAEAVARGRAPAVAAQEAVAAATAINAGESPGVCGDKGIVAPHEQRHRAAHLPDDPRRFRRKQEEGEQCRMVAGRDVIQERTVSYRNVALSTQNRVQPR